MKTSPAIYRFDLIRHLVWRDFVLRYKRSVLGVLWSLLPPLAQLLILVFLFRRVIPLNIEAYPAFVFSALLPWIWFSTCLGSGGYLFTNHRDLVRRPNFEPWTLVVVRTFSDLINYLIFLPVLLIMLIVYGCSMTPYLLFFPVLLLIQIFLTVGLNLVIATFNVFYRDVQYITNVALMLVFYLTPVFYNPDALGHRYRFLYTSNPIGVLIGSYRAIFFYGSAPDWHAVFFALFLSLAVLAIGYFVYNHEISDVIDAI
jgi:lipopolysaccharide transport system permease protein